MYNIKSITKRMFLLLLSPLMLSGCVKETVEMQINKDKSMSVVITTAYSKEYLDSLDGSSNEFLVNEEEKAEYESRGIIVEDYQNDEYKGIKLTKKVKNIDEISSKDESSSDFSSLFEDNAQTQYYFKVKKGFFKNVYSANFNASNNYSEEDFTSNLEGMPAININDLKKMVDVSFSLKIPEEIIASNATYVSSDGLELKWDFLSDNAPKTIEFEFYIYNRNHVYALGACIIALILIFISTFIDLSKKRAKKEKLKVYSTRNVNPKDIGEVDETETSMNNQMNTDLSI